MAFASFFVTGLPLLRMGSTAYRRMSARLRSHTHPAPDWSRTYARCSLRMKATASATTVCFGARATRPFRLAAAAPGYGRTKQRPRAATLNLQVGARLAGDLAGSFGGASSPNSSSPSPSSSSSSSSSSPSSSPSSSSSSPCSPTSSASCSSCSGASSGASPPARLPLGSTLCSPVSSALGSKLVAFDGKVAAKFRGSNAGSPLSGAMTTTVMSCTDLLDTQPSGSLRRKYNRPSR
mmetsp:Transcript_9309/g.16794  ORF Transcript_9309/g.16794 Transcript_9309/m.16794 type:complete len:236 (-) Transcript_9309:552-1259(-)